MQSDPFVNAVESMNPAAVPDVLAEDVSFRSPVVFTAYEGREAVGLILTEGAMKVFEDFATPTASSRGDSAALISRRRSATASSRGSTCCASTTRGRSAS